MLRTTLSLVTVMLMAGIATAAERTWTFEDPKKVNAIGILLDSDIEPIRGMANGISGTITYDPKNPASFKGSISVDVGSIAMSNPTMTEHLHGAQWLNAEKFGKITFTFEKAKVDDIEDDGEVELDVIGTFSAMGRTLKKEVEIDVMFIPGGASERGGGEGDLLVLRSDFDISRSDLGIRSDIDSEKVANKIELDVAIAGYEVKCFRIDLMPSTMNARN